MNSNGNLLKSERKTKSCEEIQGQFMGLIRFTPESWNWVKETIQHPLPKTVEKLDMTTLLQGMLEHNFSIQSISTDGLWLECDSGRDIETYEDLYSQ